MPIGIPLRGFLAPFPRALDTQNPQLIPSMDFPSSSGGGATLDVLSPAKYLTTFPRTDATVTCTIGGSITNNDVITLTFTNAIIPAIGANLAGTYAVTYTAVTADTTTTVAEGLESVINLDGNLQAMGIYATMAGTGNATRLIIRQSGPIGNSTTVSGVSGGSHTETLTFGNAGVMAGGTGPIIPVEGFKFSYNGVQMNFWYGKPQTVDSGLLAALITAQAPVL